MVLQRQNVIPHKNLKGAVDNRDPQFGFHREYTGYGEKIFLKILTTYKINMADPLRRTCDATSAVPVE